MKWIKILLAMIQFFTRIPINHSIILDKKDFGRGLIFAPVVGSIIGGYMVGVFYLLNLYLPIEVSAIFLIIAYVLITGGLHFDGLGDTFDGIFSNRPKDKVLEIMRDSRVGTNAVLAIVSVYFINYAVLSNTSIEKLYNVLFLMPVAGRIGSLAGAALHKYARTGEGLGKTFVDYCGKKELIIGNVFTIGIFYSILSNWGIILSIFTLITAIGLSYYFAKKIDGITGDVLGAVCELNQTVFLLGFLICSSYL